MWITIEDVLGLPAMSDATILAGHDGLGRNVKSVTVLDAPDASLWLQGNELVLTSTFPLVNRRRGLKLVIEELVAKNVAGLGVKLQRYLTDLPKPMIERANELAFPIISIPNHIAWIDLINPIFSRILNYNVHQVLWTEEIRRKFSQQLISDGGLGQLLGLLHSMLGLPVLLESPPEFFLHGQQEDSIFRRDTAFSSFRRRIISTGLKPIFPDIYRLEMGDARIVFIYLNKDSDTRSFIAVQELNGPLDSLQLSCLTYARDVIFMSLLQERASITIKREQLNEFVLHLIDGHMSHSAKKVHIANGREKNIPLYDRYFVALIKLHDPGKEVLDKAKSFLYGKQEENHVLVAYMDEFRFLLLIPVQTSEIDEQDLGVRTLKSYMNELQGIHDALEWNAGISHMTDTLHLNKAFQQAEYALSHSLSFGQQRQIKLHDETSLYRLLMHPSIQKDVSWFIDDWLGPLITHDKKRKARLIRTMRTFIDTNGNYRETARRLHVHHNTVRYRIIQIHKLTHRNVLDPNIYLQYKLALILYDLSLQHPDRIG